MKQKLEAVTNIATILTCAALLFVVGRNFLASGPPTRPVAFQPGDKVPALSGLQLNAEKTLLMVLRHDCKFCAESVPFYRELIERVAQIDSTHRPELAIVTTDDRMTAERYLHDHSLQINQLVTLSPEAKSTMKVPGTPSLLLVDNTGRILKLWYGKLNADREQEVLSALN